MNIQTLYVLFMLSSAQNDLPPNLLSSLCYIESGYNTKAIHLDDGPEDSIGVCQIHYSTAKQMGFRGKKSELLNPQVNVTYAGKYLKYQINRYHGNVAKAVIAYNHGNAKNLTASKYQVKVFKYWKDRK